MDAVSCSDALRLDGGGGRPGFLSGLVDEHCYRCRSRTGVEVLSTGSWMSVEVGLWSACAGHGRRTDKAQTAGYGWDPVWRFVILHVLTVRVGSDMKRRAEAATNG